MGALAPLTLLTSAYRGIPSGARAGIGAPAVSSGPMASASPTPWSGGHWLSGLLMAGWLVGCDAWVKMIARVATCSATPTLGDAAAAVWSVPAGCGETDFLGFARLSPVVRDGGPFGLGAGLLTGAAGTGWAVALLVTAAIVSGLILRWPWRATGDAAALGALWGAVLILAGPRLAGDGAGTAELVMGTLNTGLGDLALVWAAGWLLWRLLAELRA